MEAYIPSCTHPDGQVLGGRSDAYNKTHDCGGPKGPPLPSIPSYGGLHHINSAVDCSRSGSSERERNRRDREEENTRCGSLIKRFF
ncbi:hypothetical protein Q8A73_015327 [Channa argus]|nr:hypothetical protein Q8A73_015327 [Channa argus]